MKIGIDIRATQIPSAGTRGIGRYIADLVTGLTRLAPEHEYVLIVLPDRPLPAFLKTLSTPARVVPLPTRMLGEYRATQPVRYLWRLGYLRAQWAHGRALARLASRERLDVLHQPCAIEFQFFPGCRPPCFLVQTFYDAIPAVFPNLYLPQWTAAQQFVYRRQLRACRSADTVVAISHSARQDAVRYAGVTAGKVRVVYPTVPEEFQPISDPARQEECFGRLGARRPYFLFCSAPDLTKNIPRVLQAFHHFQQEASTEYQIVLVTQNADSVRAAAFDAGLTRTEVLITGFVTDEDLVTLYCGALALVSPSLYEGFGLPAAQAMRAGTPVIASDRAAQPEVVGDAGLLVNPEDVGAIADAMRRLAGDPALRAELSARGLERARQFDWQNQARAMLEIFVGGRLARPKF